MAAKRITLRYGVAAVVIALAIIGTSLYVNPMTANAKTNFVVMLTDPPKVPDGTTELWVTYSDIQVHVRYPDGTSNWVASDEGGSVDLLTLVGVSETLTNLELQTGSTIDRLKLTISSATAKINGDEYDVKILTEQLVINLKETKLEGFSTGALIDLRPILHELKAVDAEGEPIYYYVLVPSANAVVKKNVSEEHRRVGARHGLTEEENEELDEEYEKNSKDVTMSDAVLKIDGDETTLTITLTNTGTRNVAINGLTIHGVFRFSRPGASSDQSGSSDDHPCTIPFKVTPEALVLRMGDHNDHEGNNKGLELEPQGFVTLTFSDAIQIQANGHGVAPLLTITPIIDNEYTIRVSGEGSQTISVTAE